MLAVHGVPLVTLPPKSLLVNDDYRVTLQTAAAIGDVILEDQLGYIIQEDYNPGVFTVGETITVIDSPSVSATVTSWV